MATDAGVECSVELPTVVIDGKTAAEAGCGPVHPSVVYFQNGWNGKKFWMAYTPYTASKVKHENPCIVCSNDGVAWVAPAGLTNPLVGPPEVNFYADTYLYFDRLSNLMYVFWQHVISSKFIYYGSTSTDGSTWTTPFVVDQWNTTSHPSASPSFIRKRDGSWISIAVDAWDSTNDNHQKLWRKTAPAITGPWSGPEECTVEPYVNSMWHLDVRRIVGGKLVGLITHHQARAPQNGLGIAWIESNDDGLSWTPGTTKPFVQGWTGRSSRTLYKCAFALDSSFAPAVGRLWTMTSTNDKIRMADLWLDPPANLADGYMENAIDRARARELPNFIGDRFGRSDGSLIGSVADSGQTWLAGNGTGGGTNPPVIVNEAVMRGSQSVAYAAINVGSNDMTVGWKVDSMARDEDWELEVRSNRPSGLRRIGLLWTGSVAARCFTLRYVGNTGTAQNLATVLWPCSGSITGPHPTADIVLEARGNRVRAWVSGQRIIDYTLTDAMVADLATSTKASFGLGGPTMKITRFMALK